MMKKKAELILKLLGISEDVPLTEQEMARALHVTFLPPHETTDRIERFAVVLEEALREVGVNVIPYEEALDEESPGGNGDGNRLPKVKPGIVIIERGDGKDGELAMDRVSGLYNNPIVGINDGPPPTSGKENLQDTLDSIVGVLAWNLAHVPIFVEDNRWTVCTMNGAVLELGDWREPAHDVLHSLVPKLSAQVVPPKREQITYRENGFDAVERGYGDHIEDFMSSAAVWRENGLMLAHTSIDELEYRNRFYKRIVSMYLDHRTGMSYGFMVKQLPVPIEPAVPLDELNGKMADVDWENTGLVQIDGKRYTSVNLNSRQWVVEIPDFWFLATRSGCNKTNLDPARDILRLGLTDDGITIETPKDSNAEECRPSYDTYAILAHGVGNIMVASLLKAQEDPSPFADALENEALSISHWHGYPTADDALPGYVFHGTENPPVSCSTPQSAVFALAGKIRALQEYWEEGGEPYRGDVHVEPHHGTNITGSMSLTDAARWVDKVCG